MNKSYKNDRLLKALRREQVDHTPIWIMRQAGRYLPEYREIRQQAGSFLKLCKTPELACEVTLQPLRRFDLDAAIIFSDILTIPDAMGLDLYFIEEEGPKFRNSITQIRDIQKLFLPDMTKLEYVFKTIKLVVKDLVTVPLIGFAGSPWTLATYMVEGGASKTFRKIKAFYKEQPIVLHQLLEKLTSAVTTYLMAQIDAGVAVIQIFDTWGSLLDRESYRTYSLKYMEEIVKQIKSHYPEVPIILFTKENGQWLEDIANSGCDAIGIDWTVDLAEAKRRVGNKVALQGNLNPALLLTTPAEIKIAAKSLLSVYNGAPGYIFNLGHGINKETPLQNVEVLINAVHQVSH